MPKNDAKLNQTLNRTDEPKTASQKRKERISQLDAEELQAQQVIKPQRGIQVLMDEDEDDSVDDDFRNNERHSRSHPSRPSRYSENNNSEISRPERNDEHFVDEATLRDIPARPGMAQRWVRVNLALSKDPDIANYDKKIQQGWRPRPVDTVSGYQHPDMNIGTTDGIVRIAGHVLMERPIETQKRHRQVIQEKTELMTQSIHGAGDAPASNKYFGAVEVSKRKVVAEQGRTRSVKIAE